ncbi:MAG: hypothetical protein JO037_19710 [Actinobacteria bacterium]|nr:hypothetical protein [Actinomycetota bacterium]
MNTAGPGRANRRGLSGALETIAQGVAQRVIELVLEALDVNALLDRIDINAVLSRTDLNAALARVDINQVLDRLDMDRLIDRIDPNPLLDRVDVDKIVDRVDIDKIVDRVDINELIGRIDMAELADKSELGALIVGSSSTVASETLDMLRSQAVGLDDFTARWAGRLRRRRYAGPPGPPELLKPKAQP